MEQNIAWMRRQTTILQLQRSANRAAADHAFWMKGFKMIWCILIGRPRG